MKKRNLSLMAASTALLLTALTFLTGGCETESVTQTDIQVRPSYTELAKGQSVTLTATGWSAYRWSLSNEAIGYLSAKVGSSVVYTVTGSGTNETQVVTASVDSAVTTSAGTNGVATTSLPYAGTARILHR